MHKYVLIICDLNVYWKSLHKTPMYKIIFIIPLFDLASGSVSRFTGPVCTMGVEISTPCTDEYTRRN